MVPLAVVLCGLYSSCAPCKNLGRHAHYHRRGLLLVDFPSSSGKHPEKQLNIKT
jgi:hypothetical protein